MHTASELIGRIESESIAATSLPTRIFRLDMQVNQVSRLLLCEFRRIVGSSGKTPVITTELTTAIGELAEWITIGTETSLKIMGTNGTGKSTLLRAMCEVVKGNSRYLLDVNSALNIVDCFGSDSHGRLFCSRVLIIDDIGTESLISNRYGNETRPIADLIHRRADELKTTIVSTNLNRSELEHAYGVRVVDRLRDFKTIRLLGKSCRGN